MRGRKRTEKMIHALFEQQTKKIPLLLCFFTFIRRYIRFHQMDVGRETSNRTRCRGLCSV